MQSSLKAKATEDQITALFLDFSCVKLEQMTQHLAACLAKLTDTQIWQRGGPHENAIGNLIFHLCGNMRQWIIHGVGGESDVRTRELEFSTTSGLTGAELTKLFQSTVAEATAVIAATTQARLLERTTPQGREVAVLDAIYQVVGHVQQHTGQIILLTKQMAAQDLDLTIPRPR
jgi:uncharacterized damage-inducible protein DinB